MGTAPRSLGDAIPVGIGDEERKLRTNSSLKNSSARERILSDPLHGACTRNRTIRTLNLYKPALMIVHVRLSGVLLKIKYSHE